jgi:site-specific recombinase XerD
MVPDGQGVTAAGRDGAVAGADEITGTVVAARPPISIREVRAELWGQPEHREAAVGYWLQSVQSPGTREGYARDIAEWFSYCDGRGVPVDDARRADVDGWRDQLGARGLANPTIARKLAAVSSFYGYWAEEGVVERNPARNAKRPRPAKGPTSITLTAQQAAQLLAYVDGLAAPPAGAGRRPDPRPAVIVRLLAETGMRVSELCGARVEDLAETGGHHVLTVTRKGGKRQQLPIAQTTRHRIEGYLAGRREGWLVRAERTDKIRQPGGRLARQYVYDLLRRLGREAGLPESVWTRLHPHVLRGSCATIAAAAGVPPHEIQLLLGHEDLRTTAGYIQHQRELDHNPVYTVAAAIAPVTAGKDAP